MGGKQEVSHQPIDAHMSGAARPAVHMPALKTGEQAGGAWQERRRSGSKTVWKMQRFQSKRPCLFTVGMERDGGLADSRAELSQHPGSVMPEKGNQGPDTTIFFNKI